jgi:hypothetical protein
VSRWISGVPLIEVFTLPPDIWIALEKRLKTDYPNVNWKTKKTYHHTPTTTRLTDEEMKTAQGVISGVAW